LVFLLSLLIERIRIRKRVNEEVKKTSIARRVIGGFFFFGGILLLISSSWGNNRSAFEPALFNLAIGIPLFWPVLKSWLNRIPFSK
jgi:hypothetical protein